MKVAIVSAYNNLLDLTLSFLDNMQRHAHPDIEHYMILVNGGCPAQAQHPFISKRIDLDKNYGFCPVLNAGLKAVPEDSDYVFFVGNDSFPVHQGWLVDLIALHTETGAMMTCPANDNPGMVHYRKFCRVDHNRYWEVNFFPSIAWLMSYQDFRKIGYLDEFYIRTGMFADNDYCRRIKQVGGKIIVSTNILLRHHLSAEGRVLGTQPQDTDINRRVFLDKWGSLHD
jgi:GT2 family glycosyltransferase